MSRIYHVRINLDAVSADLNTLVDDAERGEWLRGFMSGASGGANRFIDSSPCYLGWHHGASARAHAEGYHTKQAEHGAKSAKVRVEKYGTAQPSKVDRTTLEGGSKVAQWSPEGTPNLTNKPINQESSKPKNKRNQQAMVPPSLDEVIAECKDKGYHIDPAKFHREQEGAEWLHRDGTKIQRWKAVLAKWESNHLEWTKGKSSSYPDEQPAEKPDNSPSMRAYLMEVELAAQAEERAAGRRP